MPIKKTPLVTLAGISDEQTNQNRQNKKTDDSFTTCAKFFLVKTISFPDAETKAKAKVRHNKQEKKPIFLN